MDEVIRALETMDSENMQDVLDTLTSRYEELNPERFLVIFSLVRNEPEKWDTQIRTGIQMLKECDGN